MKQGSLTIVNPLKYNHIQMKLLLDFKRGGGSIQLQLHCILSTEISADIKQGMTSSQITLCEGVCVWAYKR